MSDQLDSELFEDVMTDLKTFKELSLENAKSVLEESWTPRLEKMLADQLQAEAEESDEDDGQEIEIELDLDSDEDDDDDEMDDDELEEITNFLSQFQEAVADDERHSDPDWSDQLSYGEPQHDGGHEDAPMLDMGNHEDGYNAGSDASVHESLANVLRDLEEGIEEVDLDREIEDFLGELDQGLDLTEREIDELLSEYGVTDVDRDPMNDPMIASDPYQTLADEPSYESDSYTEFDPGFEYGQLEFDLESLPDSSVNEGLSYRDLLDEMEYYEDEIDDSMFYDEGDMNDMAYDDDMDEYREEAAELRETLNKYRQAVEILRNQINEVNLVNSKLLYTNKLNNSFNLNTRQQKRVVNAFDRASNLREVKLTYANIAENFNEANRTKVNTNSNSSVSRITESIKNSVSGGTQKNNSTKPSSSILNENVDMKSRMQKLAGVLNGKNKGRNGRRRKNKK